MKVTKNWLERKVVRSVRYSGLSCQELEGIAIHISARMRQEVAEGEVRTSGWVTKRGGRFRSAVSRLHDLDSVSDTSLATFRKIERTLDSCAEHACIVTSRFEFSQKCPRSFDSTMLFLNSNFFAHKPPVY